MSGRLPLTVELNTTYLAKEIDISRIILDDCVLPDVRPVPGFDLGFHGNQANMGIAHATAYANANDLKMQPVVFTVKTENPIHRSFPLSDLPNTDYLHCGRLSGKVCEWLSDFWYSEMEGAGWEKFILDNIKWGYPERFIPLYPDAISKFLALPEVQHLKIFVYPVMFPKGTPAKGIVHVAAAKRSAVSSARLRYHANQSVAF